MSQSESSGWEGQVYERVLVAFRDGCERIDKVYAPTKYEARVEAYSHAAGLRERPDVVNAYRIEEDE